MGDKDKNRDDSDDSGDAMHVFMWVFLALVGVIVCILIIGHILDIIKGRRRMRELEMSIRTQQGSAGLNQIVSEQERLAIEKVAAFRKAKGRLPEGVELSGLR